MVECPACFTVQEPGAVCCNARCGAQLPLGRDPRMARRLAARRRRRNRDRVPVVPINTAMALGGVGILDDRDLRELNAGAQRVAQLMVDGRWHTAEEIKLAAGDGVTTASEGLRRARELRDLPGVALIKRRMPGHRRRWQYRLVRLDD